MPVNPAMAALGLAPEDRAVVLHVDDVGMCQATIPAAVELVSDAKVTCVSVMATCPWAQSACRELIEARADVGVHLTLTSEWSEYRWPSLTAAPDLHDAEGRLPRTNEEVWAHAIVESVAAEVAAQIDRLTGWGVDVTHLDSHMGSGGHAAFLHAVADTALGRGVLPMVPNWSVDVWRDRGFPEQAITAVAAFGNEMAERGVPMVDHLACLPLDNPDNQLEIMLHTLDNLRPGITHLYAHPAVDTAELRAIGHDWPARVANLECLRDDQVVEHARKLGIELIGYRTLRDLMR